MVEHRRANRLLAARIRQSQPGLCVLYLETGDLDPAEVRVWCGTSGQEPGGLQPMTVLAPGLLRIERCPRNYQVGTTGGEPLSLEIGSHPIGYSDHTPPELDAQLRLRVATSTETSCGAQSTVRADYEPGWDPAIGVSSYDGGGVVTGGSGEWFGVRVHLLYEHPRSTERTAVGYSMSTWMEPYTGPRRSWIPLDDLPSGRHCYVLGAMDNSGNLTVDETPACIDVP